MRKFIIVGITALSLSLVTPMVTWAEEIIETVSITAQIETMKEAFTEALESKTMYANKAGVNIREKPDIEARILDQTMLNTSFEVIGEYDGWSMITTEDGYAYVKSEYLSDTEIETPQYTEKDLYILAHVICGEAQGYSGEEQRYVGSVVLNRVKHPKFPDTIEDVVFQPGQYACVQDGNYYREPTEENWSNAQWLLENGSVLPLDVIWQSKGKQGRGVFLKTQWHSYCF